MAEEARFEGTNDSLPEGHDSSGGATRTPTWSPWFVGGVGISILGLCSLSLLAVLLASVGLNAYLAWQLSGLEILIVRPGPETTAVAPAPPTIAAILPTSTSTTPPATNTPPPSPTDTPLPTSTPSPPPTEVATLQPTAPPPATDPPAPAASNNAYELIPLEGERDSRPGDEHADLNLKLRDLEPVEVELTLVEVSGRGDPDAPKLRSVFEPNFVGAYAVHKWDWSCNCKAGLEDTVSAVKLATRSGQPLYIPKRQQDIYAGKYYAVVLYASEDSVTFLYGREGTVAHAYSIHYQGLRTDANLLKLYRNSRGNELPGLTLDTPVGIATDELIVAVRDAGVFMDARSRKDWWQ